MGTREDALGASRSVELRKSTGTSHENRKGSMTQKDRRIEQSNLHVQGMEIRSRKAELKSNYQYELGKLKVEQAHLEAECARSCNAAIQEDEDGFDSDFLFDSEDEPTGYD